MSDYAAFLARKAITDPATGLRDVPALNPMLKPFQRDLTAWALRRGRAALWADCGLGKGPMALTWAQHVPGDVLILAPLAVSEQFLREADKFSVPDVGLAKRAADIRTRVTVTNYERLDAFDVSRFTGVVLDESSILKAFDGKTRSTLIAAFADTPFRLCCTATPAPNDYMELGNHAEFLSVMSRAEMLSMFFVHDGGETQQWRLKGHAEKDFWTWLCSWAMTLQRPSDLGYADDGFLLPDLTIQQTTIQTDTPPDGYLFPIVAETLGERLAARRSTIAQRVAACAALVATEPDEHWAVWCNLNAESEALAAAIPWALEISGSDDADYKAAAARWFTGALCLCDKLPEWRPTAKSISRAITESIARSDWRTQKPTWPPISNAIENTSGNTSAPTPSGQTSSRNDSLSVSSIWRDGVSNTNPTQPCERNAKPTRAHGRNKTQIDDSDIGSKLTDSRSSNTEPSCHARATRAPFAVSMSHQIARRDPRQENENSPSTIATPQDAFEESCAPLAISGLGSSTTPSTDSSLQSCICGRPLAPRAVISKGSIFGFGVNWQHCARAVFVGLSDSYESFYQSVRRIYRFGQTRPVVAHVITADTEGNVVQNISRKERDAEAMRAAMVEHMHDLNAETLRGAAPRFKTTYATTTTEGDGWTAYQGDCVETLAALADDSVDFTVYSPPFSSLYTYSASDRDMGNCTDDAMFMEHYLFLCRELLRVTKPGRLVSFHCMNLPTLKSRDGFVGVKDFRGDLIRAHQSAGWIFHAEVCIWKDPVTAMQRTKSLRLLHKQLKKDSAMSGQGIPDYLVTMRKPGDNPDRVSHTNETFPVSEWQKIASPVWMDINPSDTLQFRSARAHQDERHIAPLQLEVIRRALRLWSNPGDLVLSPFMGIGSEGVVSLEQGRRFVGVELKDSYYQQACRNLADATQTASAGLFAAVEAS